MRQQITEFEFKHLIAIIATILVFAALIGAVLNMGHETPTSACVPSKELLAEKTTVACVPAAEDTAAK